ncbi:hypothetical protein D030_1418B, partial [Vibrio parahaemolyticus AQ3810]
SHPEH